ncbi:PilW family protein [Candidatus Uabimicrobium sp. HlEnr_7]|uniref:PilW family protein n=1 Tax=Candidatus Uabimicrobium helgolandensis TaxID=3095367 RepID=UPI003556AF0D
MIKQIKNQQAGITLLEIIIASSLFTFMMGITLSLTFNIQDLTKAEIDRSHLQSQLQDVVDKIVSDIRESKWRWTYVTNASNGDQAANTFFVYPTGRDRNGIFHFQEDGADAGLTRWQGMSLLVAIPSDNANINNSGETRFDLWKFTHFSPSIIPLVKDGPGGTEDLEDKDDVVLLEPGKHADITIDEDEDEIFIRGNNGVTLITFNKSGTVQANQTSQLLMKNVTRFFINAETDDDGQLVLPEDDNNVAKYRFPFSLDIEAFYVSTNVRVSLSTAVLAENKNNL